MDLDTPNVSLFIGSVAALAGVSFIQWEKKNCFVQTVHVKLLKKKKPSQMNSSKGQQQ